MAGKYVPPSMRTRGPGEAPPRGSSMGGPGVASREDLPTLRVTNISEETQENDLRELFGAFGRVARVYVGRDRETGVGKGFAFVSFDDRLNAQKAMEKLNGKGYDNLILSVQWSREYTFLSFSLCVIWSIADCIGVVQNRDLMVDDWFALCTDLLCSVVQITEYSLWPRGGGEASQPPLSLLCTHPGPVGAQRFLSSIHRAPFPCSPRSLTRAQTFARSLVFSLGPTTAQSLHSKSLRVRRSHPPTAAHSAPKTCSRNRRRSALSPNPRNTGVRSFLCTHALARISRRDALPHSPKTISLYL